MPRALDGSTKSTISVDTRNIRSLSSIIEVSVTVTRLGALTRPYTLSKSMLWGHVDILRTFIFSNRTSGMADDVIVLLNFIGWTDARQLHVVGISMGGMISQGMFAGP